MQHQHRENLLFDNIIRLLDTTDPSEENFAIDVEYLSGLMEDNGYHLENFIGSSSDYLQGVSEISQELVGTGILIPQKIALIRTITPTNADWVLYQQLFAHSSFQLKNALIVLSNINWASVLQSAEHGGDGRTPLGLWYDFRPVPATKYDVILIMAMFLTTDITEQMNGLFQLEDYQDILIRFVRQIYPLESLDDLPFALDEITHPPYSRANFQSDLQYDLFRKLRDRFPLTTNQTSQVRSPNEEQSWIGLQGGRHIFPSTQEQGRSPQWLRGL